MSNLLSAAYNQVFSNEVVFISDSNRKLGTLKVVGNELIFTPRDAPNDPITLTSNSDSGIIPDGVNFGDYLIWDDTDPSNPQWVVNNTKIRIGANAGKNNQGNYSIAIGNKAGETNQASNTIILNADSTALDGPTGPALYIHPIRFETALGTTGTFEYSDDSKGITGSQSTNVLSYNPTSKEITYRNLGLYYDQVKGVDTENDSTNEGAYRIVSNASIIPSIDGVTGPTGATNISQRIGYDLGNRNAFWKTLYAREIYMSRNTLYVIDEDTNDQMSVKYDPKTLASTISNADISVKAVTTSTNIPGQIDPSLMPFTGMNFIGKFNADAYVNAVSSDFDIQTLHLIYTGTYDSLVSPFTPTENSIINTAKLFSTLPGSYYTVSGMTDTQNLTFSKLRASTDLSNLSKTTEGAITSLFEKVSTETLTVSNNDILILSAALETLNDIIYINFQWSQVQFKVPISGVTTQNLEDNAITTPKITANAITSTKIAANAITAEKLSTLSVSNTHLQNSAVTFNKLSPELQNMLVKASNNGGVVISGESFNAMTATIESLQNQVEYVSRTYERRILALEEFVQVMLQTYEIKNTSNQTYNYQGDYQSLVNPFNISLYKSFSGSLSRETSINRAISSNILITLNIYTYNALQGNITVSNRMGAILKTCTKNDFNEVSLNTEFDTSNLRESDFPLSFKLYSLSNVLLNEKTLTYFTYTNL